MTSAVDYQLYSDAFHADPAPEEPAGPALFTREGFAIPESMRELIRTEAERWRDTKSTSRREKHRRGFFGRILHK